MSTAQHRVSDYLQSELYHSLGSYGVAAERLRDLEVRLDKAQEDSFSAAGADTARHDELLRLTRIVRAYNQALATYRHGTDPILRHPIPQDLPMTLAERFDRDADASEVRGVRDHPWIQPLEWAWVLKYYDAAAFALRHSLGNASPRLTGSDAEIAVVFAGCLTTRRDGPPDAESDQARVSKLCEDRLARYEARRSLAYSSLASAPSDDKSHASPELLHRIATDNLSTGPGSLPFFVLAAHAEAHLSMHAVEAWCSMSLQRHAERSRDDLRWLNDELRRCIALGTFAYSAGRAAPWLFAEDAEECEHVFRDFENAWQNVVPTRCMWIAAQVSLLALHRRAYAYALLGDLESAYNDYHKLHRLLRDTERRIQRAPIHVDGSLEFLTGLAAQAHHHIGELYRAAHAQTSALTHFEAAAHRLDDLRSKERMRTVLVNSRWHVQLHVSRGKACYELGRHKESLQCHLRAWQALLSLLAADTGTEANTQDIERAVRWLETVLYEPELRKSDVLQYLDPIVSQLQRITVDARLRSLAAEILLRLGHLLLVLNLVERRGGERGAHDLAAGCLVKACECDPHSTLVGTDLLKISYRRPGETRRAVDKKHERQVGKALEQIASVATHWPMGGDDYERLARVTEFLQLRALEHRGADKAGTTSARQEDAQLAAHLLLNFFTHTDSINVRKSQAHQFLMRPRLSRDFIGNDTQPSIEFVCMRRYSSAFPLLPRPSAFRALGGGYFINLRVVEGKRGAAVEKRSFGIVVDPGADFVENLYRTGRSLSDIDLVIVTHDHVDHLGALDPLLSLLYSKASLEAREAHRTRRPKQVPILVNDSVFQRYEKVAQLRNPDRFRALSRLTPTAVGRLLPEGFELISLNSHEVDQPGHLDLSNKPSYGICIRGTGGGPSLAITSDVPAPPHDAAERRAWKQTWAPALTADVLVAHLSTVPLTELRQMTRLDATLQPDSAADDAEILQTIAEALERSDADNALRGRIEFALWLRSRDLPSGDPGPKAKLLEPVDKNWAPPAGHPYLGGLLDWARAYRSARGGEGGLFVVGELSEELGTMRGKIAARLNETLFSSTDKPSARHHALTADIGLHILVQKRTPLEGPHDARTRVLCTTCNLDTDRIAQERFHPAHHVHEVCVKGENEGIFYNCDEHDPSRQRDPAFLEQLERFDVFGR
jgi:tetratricopeptide (TPR) repeat protein